jgi:trehalose/maltose hydrolase-like predicted phosphorylase
MDRILKAEDDSPDNYQVSKQADTLMIWYILTPQETTEVLGKMGYTIDDPYEFLRRNYEYYIARTSHGSTLSYVVHAAILTYLPGNESDMCDWFMEAMKSDIYDTQGGTTLEAIHCGVMAGTLQIIVDNFAGLEARPRKLLLMPSMPCGWEHTGFTLRYRGNRYDLAVSPGRVKVSMSNDATGSIEVSVDGSRASLEPGKTVTLEYSAENRA